MNDTTATSRDFIGKTDQAGHCVCPWWLGYFLASPVRRLVENPELMLGPLVRPGMTVLEPGCGMGFFSLPLARLVGPQGRVICVDLQQKMIDGLRRRARRAGLTDRIEATVCGPADLGADKWIGKVDLALAIHVVHEVPDRAAFLRQIHAALREGGKLLIVEPRGHVDASQFAATTADAEAAGFALVPGPPVRGSLSVVLSKVGTVGPKGI
jgi:2-polyprenyl-3-methyl-5-hydroxy-6-metoxy-1,4-benzoquinol methylase